MRITAGKYGRRVLKAPTGKHIRPTSDKVRQAIFNILLQYDLPRGAVVIDGFCGSGALGLEALSRGATFCTFIDNHKKSVALCGENIAALSVDEGAHRLLRRDATKPGDRAEDTPLATLVFLDPPYNKGLAPKALKALAGNNWLNDGALCVVETEESETDIAPAGFTVVDARVYGQTRVWILQFGVS